MWCNSIFEDFYVAHMYKKRKNGHTTLHRTILTIFDMGKLRILTKVVSHNKCKHQECGRISKTTGFDMIFFDLMKKVPMYNFIPMLRANLPYRGHLVRPKSAWENVTVLTKKVQYAIERRTIKNSIEWKGKKNNHEPVQK